VKALALGIIIPLIWASSAWANEEDAKKSFTMFAKWECSIWANMMGDTEASERLFLSGLEDANIFVNAAWDGKITPEQARTSVPFSVSLSMQGPNPDFVIGRLYEMISSTAHDKIVTQDRAGMPLAPADFVTDKELQRSLANGQFHSANCHIF